MDENGYEYFARPTFTDGAIILKTDSDSSPDRVSLFSQRKVHEAFAYFLQLLVADLNYKNALEIAVSIYHHLSSWLFLMHVLYNN